MDQSSFGNRCHDHLVWGFSLFGEIAGERCLDWGSGWYFVNLESVEEDFCCTHQSVGFHCGFSIRARDSGDLDNFLVSRFI